MARADAAKLLKSEEQELECEDPKVERLEPGLLSEEPDVHSKFFLSHLSHSGEGFFVGNEPVTRVSVVGTVVTVLRRETVTLFDRRYFFVLLKFLNP